MSKRAEEFIRDCTKSCSNELVGGGHHEWVTPEQALRAVEIAREETALIPEDMGVIFNLVRKLQYKYGDVRGCYEEALKLFNKAKDECAKG